MTEGVKPSCYSPECRRKSAGEIARCWLESGHNNVLCEEWLGRDRVERGAGNLSGRRRGRENGASGDGNSHRVGRRRGSE